MSSRTPVRGHARHGSRAVPAELAERGARVRLLAARVAQRAHVHGLQRGQEASAQLLKALLPSGQKLQATPGPECETPLMCPVFRLTMAAVAAPKLASCSCARAQALSVLHAGQI